MTIIGVNRISMHAKVENEYIAACFGVMAACPQHTFQILTKRAERLPEWFAWIADEAGRREALVINELLRFARRFSDELRIEHLATEHDRILATPWPLPNVWLGVSVENQEYADERIPHLLRAPAAIRFLSCEPLLGPLDLRQLNDGSWYDREGAQCYDALTGHAYYRDGEHGLAGGPRIDWVIAGGESGRGARRHDVEWTRSIVKQCRKAKIPVFVKQMGANVIDRNDRFNTCGDTDPDLADHWPLDDPDAVEENIDGYRTEHQGAPVRIRLRSKKGGDMEEWPPDLRVRQFPGVRR